VIRKRLTYANVVSTLALCIVIAGGTAAALPGKKTVQANDLKKNAVKATAIAKNAVRAAEVKTGAVGSSEVADGAVTGADVADQGLGYQDLGSNSVIARMASTASIQTGDGGQANPVSIPLSGNTWTQAPNETDVLFGEVTYRQPPVCTMGSLRIELLLDGQVIDVDTFGFDTAPNATVAEPLAQLRPYAFETGAANTRTLTLRASDSCDLAGEQFSVEGVELNAVAIR
jgi:hypothetical protein